MKSSSNSVGTRVRRVVGLGAIALLAAGGGVSLIGGNAQAARPHTASLPSIPSLPNIPNLPSGLPNTVNLGDLQSRLNEASTRVQAGIGAAWNALPPETKTQLQGIFSSLPIGST